MASLTHCPTCRTKLTASREIVPGFTVYGCRSCKKFAVDVPGVTLGNWISGGPGVNERLRDEAEHASRWQRALHAGEEDKKTGMVAPGDEAWERLEVGEWL
jgi:hypothetical protein